MAIQNIDSNFVNCLIFSKLIKKMAGLTSILVFLQLSDVLNYYFHFSITNPPHNKEGSGMSIQNPKQHISYCFHQEFKRIFIAENSFLKLFQNVKYPTQLLSSNFCHVFLQNREKLKNILSKVLVALVSVKVFNKLLGFCEEYSLFLCCGIFLESESCDRCKNFIFP